MMGRGDSLDAQIEELQAMYLAGAIEGVALVAADASACPACLAVTDQAYMPSRLPRVPLDGCTAPGGCRCRYEPAVTVYE